jgi:hypothetical protein
MEIGNRFPYWGLVSGRLSLSHLSLTSANSAGIAGFIKIGTGVAAGAAVGECISEVSVEEGWL